MIAAGTLAVKTTNEQILPKRFARAGFVVALAIAFAGCGLDADEETSTATTPAPLVDGATGPSGPSGPTGPTGPTGADGEGEGTEPEVEGEPAG
jgi:hypothetical protein